MTDTAHSVLKPLIISRPGMIMIETLAHCASMQSKKRSAKSENDLRVNCYYEFPFYPVGRVSNKIPRVDAVVQVFFYGALKYGDSFTVAIEIKESWLDLTNKYNQIENYVGHTDFLMLGVNEYLLPHALKRVANIPECGVFDIYTGKIYKAPKRQHISPEAKLRVQETFLIAFNRQKEIAIAKSERKFKQIVFDCKYAPDDPEQKAAYWAEVSSIQAERDQILSQMPYNKRMTSYYDVSKQVERQHRRC